MIGLLGIRKGSELEQVARRLRMDADGEVVVFVVELEVVAVEARVKDGARVIGATGPLRGRDPILSVEVGSRVVGSI